MEVHNLHVNVEVNNTGNVETKGEGLLDRDPCPRPGR